MTAASARLLALLLLAAQALGGTPAFSGENTSGMRVEEADDDVESRRPTETVTLDGREVAIWQPETTPGTHLPLIVFSAGFTACNTASSFLTSALAHAGYIVAAPEHADSACAGGREQRPEQPFGTPKAWSDATYRQRGRDIAATIDALKSDPEWSQRIDPDRIGLMGHSLGGYTVLALAGARPTWQHSDIKAVLAMAPLIGPLLANGRLENIHVPVMYQAGARDAATTALIKKLGGAYDRTPAATYAEFRGATHFAWSDGGGTLKADIAAVSIAFFDAKLKGRALAGPHVAGVTVFKQK